MAPEAMRQCHIIIVLNFDIDRVYYVFLGGGCQNLTEAPYGGTWPMDQLNRLCATLQGPMCMKKPCACALKFINGVE